MGYTGHIRASQQLSWPSCGAARLQTPSVLGFEVVICLVNSRWWFLCTMCQAEAKRSVSGACRVLIQRVFCVTGLQLVILVRVVRVQADKHLWSSDDLVASDCIISAIVFDGIRQPARAAPLFPFD